MSRRITFLGDTHGQISDLPPVLAKMQARPEIYGKQIFQVGDWQYVWPGDVRTKRLQQLLQDADITMYFIRGNHDWRAELERLDYAETAFQYVEGRAFDKAGGVLIPNLYAIGGAYSIDRDDRDLFDPVIFNRGHVYFEDEVVNPTTVTQGAVYGAAHRDYLLVTHDARSVPPRRLQSSEHFEETLGSANQRELLRTLPAPAWHIHGHWHERYTWQYGRTKTIGLDHTHNYIEQAMVTMVQDEQGQWDVEPETLSLSDMRNLGMTK